MQLLLRNQKGATTACTGNRLRKEGNFAEIYFYEVTSVMFETGD